MFIHPGQIQSAFRDLPEVSRFRAVVSREGNRDLLTVKVEVGEGASEELRTRLEERIREVLRIGADVVWAGLGTLPADGKVIEDSRKWE
jgi:phenylacetate-CoA ligase